jgi:aminoglycoside phosphotransferase (APT) family kinase protein
MTPPREALIDRVLDRLTRRGVVEPEQAVTVEVLQGGVSADVLALSVGDRRMVVKRALPRLRVAQEWLASPARVIVEADAIAFAGRVRPGNVPEIIDVDADSLVIVMTAAPPGMVNWRTELLVGIVDATLPARLGAALADWHSASGSDQGVRTRFADRTHFFDLRVSAFLQRIAEVHPDLGPTVGRVIDRMMSRTVCLVHGDFSPKNVLANAGSFWVLDWEIAHIGDPTFDLAFLLSHLACKAIHRPDAAADYRACAETFLATYLGRSSVEVDQGDLVRQAGCLLLARVDGKSPVDYFTPAEQHSARAVARRVLLRDLADPADLWGTG